MSAVQKDRSVAQLLNSAAASHGNKEVIYDLKKRLTYNELLKLSERAANGLQKLGIKKGDRVGVCLPNWHETAVIFFAASKLGAVVVPFNPVYRSHEIEYILKNAEPSVLFISEKFGENVGFPLAKALVKHVVSVRFEERELLSYTKLLANHGEVVREEAVDVNEDLFCILYTSGTTGLPKGVMTAHRSIVQCAYTVAEEMKCDKRDVFIIPAPLFHIFGITCNLMTAIASGARMILQEKYHPKQVLKLIEKEKVTVHQGVPTMFLKELEQEDFSQYDLSSLRTGMVGASPISPEQVKKVRKQMNFHLCQSYGITETGSVTITRHNDDEKTLLETVGRPLKGIKIKIVDKNHNPLPPGQVGEIAVHSFAMMKGYYKMPDKTSQVLEKEGWFYTGDLGMVDEKGNVRFTGRQKEMIIRGGFNIYPQEIEAILTKHPKVIEAAVIGLPDEVLGETVCAVIQLKKSIKCTEEEMKNFTAESVAAFKVPEQVVFTSNFPVTASGKIQKGKLKDQLLERINS
ncbi:class I adenylate-forming enzyme family protein [Alteribacillus sp. JSM 102045]|uniref:class I adenylate-forming enzyme family protein n=1 Tax=Alteribacillus sp. JSM 102045 TaxID=1562101 RepID=UPI0035BF032F